MRISLKLFLILLKSLKRRKTSFLTRCNLSAGIGGRRLGGKGRRSSSNVAATFSLADMIKLRSRCNLLRTSLPLGRRSLK